MSNVKVKLFLTPHIFNAVKIFFFLLFQVYVVYYVCATIGVFVLLVAAVKGFFLVGIIKFGKEGGGAVKGLSLGRLVEAKAMQILDMM